MGKEITFTAARAPSKMGGKDGVCHSCVNHLDILSEDDIARDMAEELRIDPAMARYYAIAVTTYISRALARGCKLNFREFSLFLSIRGKVDGANGEFTPGRNKVCVNIAPGRNLRAALAALRPKNAARAEGVEQPRINDILDTSTREHGCITPGEKIYIAGAGLETDTRSEDEGIWLSDGEKRVHRGRITASTATTLDAVFDAPVAPGAWTLTLATRSAQAARIAPFIVTRKIRVAETAAQRARGAPAR